MTTAEIIKLIWDILGPIAVAMFQAVVAGKDPLDVLAKERLAQIVPEHLLLSLARVAERARRGLPPDA